MILAVNGCYLVAFTVLLTIFSIGNCLHGQQPIASESSDTADTAEAKKHFLYFDSLAQAFNAKLASGDSLKMVKEPLLKWTIDSSWHGSFFVWTSKDRPVLIGCFLTDSESAENRTAYVEMHTIVDEPFTPMAFSGVLDYEWDPSYSSQSVIAVPTLPTPAKGVQQKRTQMRMIAESFSVTMYEDEPLGDGTEQLRMLSAPLYRYPETGSNGLTGAIYAFVRTNGTDPEFLLAIEQDPKKNADEWKIRPIRFTTRRLELHHRDQVVWRVSDYNSVARNTNLTETYMIIKLLESSTLEYNAVRDHMIEVSHSKD